MDDIHALAVQIYSYSHTALSMFAEELEVPPIKPAVMSVAGAIMRWKEKWQKENDESAKKALAQKLMNLSTYWQEFFESNQYQNIPEMQKVNFEHCARHLDIQGNPLFNKYINCSH